jgi:hypothetical protein
MPPGTPFELPATGSSLFVAAVQLARISFIPASLPSFSRFSNAPRLTFATLGYSPWLSSSIFSDTLATRYAASCVTSLLLPLWLEGDEGRQSLERLRWCSTAASRYAGSASLKSTARWDRACDFAPRAEAAAPAIAERATADVDVGEGKGRIHWQRPLALRLDGTNAHGG